MGRTGVVKKMSRRRFYAPPGAFSDDEKLVTLAADEARHLRDVLRLGRGDEAFVFDGEGREFRCRVEEARRDGAILSILESVPPARPESTLQLTLWLALLKGEKFDLAVQKATELGVMLVVPVVTKLADVRLRDARDARKRVERWQRIALEAAKQSGRARVPEVSAPIIFAEQAEKNFHADDELRLMFAERDGESLAEVVSLDKARPSKASVLVGSEGGWTDEEIERGRACGWRIVTLGGRTLRAETAAIVAVTLVQHLMGDLL